MFLANVAAGRGIEQANRSARASIMLDGLDEIWLRQKGSTNHGMAWEMELTARCSMIILATAGRPHEENAARPAVEGAGDQAGSAASSVSASVSTLIFGTTTEGAGSQRASPGMTGMDPIDRRCMSIMQGYTGNACQECQNFTMIRNGTCEKCTTCGSFSGCS